jgi:hypothetical protein
MTAAERKALARFLGSVYDALDREDLAPGASPYVTAYASGALLAVAIGADNGTALVQEMNRQARNVDQFVAGLMKHGA